MKQEKANLKKSSQDAIRLEEAKKYEKKYRKRLKRIQIPNGYVLTTQPNKWYRYLSNLIIHKT